MQVLYDDWALLDNSEVFTLTLSSVHSARSVNNIIMDGGEHWARITIPVAGLFGHFVPET